MEQDLRNTPLELFEKTLKLQDIKYDKGYNNQILHETGIYHIQGFHIIVDLEKKYPESNEISEIEKNGKLFMGN